MASAQRTEVREAKKEPNQAQAQPSPAPAYQSPDSIPFVQTTDAGLVVLNVPGM